MNTFRQSAHLRVSVSLRFSADRFFAESPDAGDDEGRDNDTEEEAEASNPSPQIGALTTPPLTQGAAARVGSGSSAMCVCICVCSRPAQHDCSPTKQLTKGSRARLLYAAGYLGCRGHRVRGARRGGRGSRRRRSGCKRCQGGFFVILTRLRTVLLLCLRAVVRHRPFGLSGSPPREGPSLPCLHPLLGTRTTRTRKKTRIGCKRGRRGQVHGIFALSPTCIVRSTRLLVLVLVLLLVLVLVLLLLLVRLLLLLLLLLYSLLCLFLTFPRRPHDVIGVEHGGFSPHVQRQAPRGHRGPSHSDGFGKR
jgi:hypothetical protein